MIDDPKTKQEQDEEVIECKPVDPEVPEVEVDFISDEE